ncbi:MAG: energy transducer TonB [Prevotella sp.]|nr:energy transducer TonB [Prevotella sp.]
MKKLLFLLLVFTLGFQVNVCAQKTSKVYDVVEQMPSFPGGQQAMMKFMKNNIRYPEALKKNKVQGMVLVQFVVDQTGRITNPVVKRSIEPSLDAEALRVVRAMPKWNPGKQNGKPVKVRYTLPVSFK